jgi:hypothetical protein
VEPVSRSALPIDVNNDFLIGGTATSTAKFSYTGIQTGQTIASVSGQLLVYPNNGYGGNASLSGVLVVGADVNSNASIQTSRNKLLTIGGNTTGNITLSPNNGTAGLVSISGSSLFTSVTGAVSLNGPTTVGAGQSFTVSSGTTSINDTAGTSTTSIGGGTTSGAVTIGGGSNTLAINTTNWDVTSAGAISGLTDYAQASGNFAISGTGTFSTGTGAISLNGNTTIPTTKTLTLVNNAGNNAVLYAAVTTGLATSTTTSTSGQCLLSELLLHIFQPGLPAQQVSTGGTRLSLSPLLILTMIFF